MALKIGNFEISTQKLYDALKEAGVTDDEKLAKADLNGDKKLDEDELVEFGALDEEEVKNSSDSSSDAQKSITSSQQSAIHSLVEMNESLNKQLKDTIARFSKTSDASELADAISSMESIQNQISTNERQIYNLMVQAETSAANAANAANAAANVGTVAQVNGAAPTASSVMSTAAVGTLDMSSPAAFAMSIVNNGSTSVDAATMKEMMTSGGYQFDDGAWCGDFCGFVLASVYGKENTPGDFYGSGVYPGVGMINDWAQEKGVYATDTSEVQPGDLIVYDRQHVGMVVAVNPDGTVDTVEGNTSNDQTGAYDSPTGEGWCSHHSSRTGQYVLLHKLIGQR